MPDPTLDSFLASLGVGSGVCGGGARGGVYIRVRTGFGEFERLFDGDLGIRESVASLDEDSERVRSRGDGSVGGSGVKVPLVVDLARERIEGV